MKKRLLFLIAPVIALFLESLPYGVIMKFADGPDSTYTETFSYFSLLPFGYAVFGPLPAAALTCVVIILALIYVLKPSTGLESAAGVLSGVAAILSLSPMIFVVFGSALSETVTVIEIIVTLLLTAEGVMFLLPKKKKGERIKSF